jgi:hypothetical protein
LYNGLTLHLHEPPLQGFTIYAHVDLGLSPQAGMKRAFSPAVSAPDTSHVSQLKTPQKGTWNEPPATDS